MATRFRYWGPHFPRRHDHHGVLTVLGQTTLFWELFEAGPRSIFYTTSALSPRAGVIDTAYIPEWESGAWTRRVFGVSLGEMWGIRPLLEGNPPISINWG